MKKICHISSLHKRDDGRIFQKECISLAKNGYNVHYIVNDNLDNEIVGNVNVISINSNKKNLFRRLISNKKLINSALKTGSYIYHIHDPELLLYVKRIKKHGGKVIFDSHEFYSLQILEKHYIPKILRKLIAFIYKKYEQYIFSFLDGLIIPCTVNGKNPFSKYANKTCIIGNQPILADRRHDDNRIKKDISKIVYVGGLSESRGIMSNIIAAHNTKSILVLAGKFVPDDFYSKLKKLKEFNSVEYLGYLKKEEINYIMQESYIGICTFLDKGQYLAGDNLATKVYEYMLNGLPVIISKNSYVEEIMKKRKFGIMVDGSNINEIESAIYKLRFDKSFYNECSENAIYLIKNKFNWEIEEKKLLLFYKKM